MRTIVVTRFGGPAVLAPRAAPEPVPGPAEVVVDVQVAEVLFVDTQVRSGWAREYFPMQPPFVPGTVIGKTVLAV